MSGPLRIGVNALYLIPGGVGGTEIYLRNLLAALARVDSTSQYFVFTNRETQHGIAPPAANFRTEVQAMTAAFRPGRLLWEQFRLPAEARRRKLNVMLNPGFTAPFALPCPSVTVFHDLQHKKHPEYFRWFDLPAWNFFLYWSARRSHSLIAVSEATREDLIRHYPFTRNRITVVPHGVEQAFFEIGRRRASLGLEKILLCVSTLHPHKNLDRLVRAFARVRKHAPEFQLVIAGMEGFHADGLRETIAQAAATEAVRLTGWIPREELLGLFERAWAFVYPSTFEGFGMPLLESMAAAIPTAVSGIEPMRSIAADAALTFNPLDEDQLETALRRILTDESLRARLTGAGPPQAANFSWEATAAKTLDVLRKACV